MRSPSGFALRALWEICFCWWAISKAGTDWMRILPNGDATGAGAESAEASVSAWALAFLSPLALLLMLLLL